jgi:hypothetical protein
MQVKVRRGVMDKTDGTAYGYYNNTLNETGWGILELTARCRTCKNTDIMFAAGYLEGILTAKYEENVHLIRLVKNSLR